MAQQQTYDIGDQPTITATFRQIGTGVLTTPNALTITVREPDGTETDYTQADATNPSVGVWEFAMPAVLDSCGIWTVKFFGTAGVIAAEEVSFKVRCSRIN